MYRLQSTVSDLTVHQLSKEEIVSGVSKGGNSLTHMSIWTVRSIVVSSLRRNLDAHVFFQKTLRKLKENWKKLLKVRINN